MDAQHNNDELKHLDRYAIWVDDARGKVALGFEISGDVLRVESMTRADHADGQQFFAVNQNSGFDNLFSYDQVVSFGASVHLQKAYTEALTVPSRDPISYDLPGVPAGEQLFSKVGCQRCHTPVQRIARTRPPTCATW